MDSYRCFWQFFDYNQYYIQSITTKHAFWWHVEYALKTWMPYENLKSSLDSMKWVFSSSMPAGMPIRLCCSEDASYHLRERRICKRVSLFAKRSSLYVGFKTQIHMTILSSTLSHMPLQYSFGFNLFPSAYLLLSKKN